MKVSRKAYVKQGSKWVKTDLCIDQTAETENKAIEDAEKTNSIYFGLLTDLIYHYMFKSPSIKKIKEVSNYDGTRTITVYYTGVKMVYIINM